MTQFLCALALTTASMTQSRVHLSSLAGALGVMALTTPAVAEALYMQGIPRVLMCGRIQDRRPVLEAIPDLFRLKVQDEIDQARADTFETVVNETVLPRMKTLCKKPELSGDDIMKQSLNACRAACTVKYTEANLCQADCRGGFNLLEGLSAGLIMFGPKK